MKKILIGLLALMMVFAFVSCMSQPEEKEQEEQPSEQGSQGPSDIPDWYLNPPVAEDSFYGVGSAKMSKLDTSRKMAISRAREDVAFQMESKIKAAITDYAQEAGVDGENQVISFVETVSKQITDTTLQGVKTEEVGVGADGTVYAMVSYPMNKFKETAVSEFQRNEDAAFAEFKAQQALEQLDSELSNNPPKAGQTKE